MGSAPGESDFVPGLEQIRRGPGNEVRNRYVYCYMEYKRRIAEAMIREGEQAFLKKGGVLKAVEIRKGRKVLFEKLHVYLDNVVGCPYGSVFEVSGNTMHQVDVGHDDEELLKPGDTWTGRTNQHITQDGSSQKLSKDDIMDFKANGMRGQDIVEHIVGNSSTFKDRTQFSQAKYRDKKKKKHITRITILRPTTSLVAEYYYLRGSMKICDLRVDTLSQILTASNVHAHCRMLVVETCQGLVVGALLSRMAGFGKLIQLYTGDFPSRLATECFNFPEHVLECLSGFPLNKLNTVTSSQETQEPLPENSPAGQASSTTHEMSARSSIRLKEENIARKELITGSMDGLVVACRFQPVSLLMALLRFLAPSRPFVVYCQYKEPLMECYVKMKEQGSAVNISLTETWWRHYQVLPARTHPEITMNSTGGYLLTGLTVDNTDSSNPAKKLKTDHHYDANE